jgi:DNA-binding NtrC family response regulator
MQSEDVKSGLTRSKGKILVVEDDESHRITLARHLSMSGFRVESAESAEAALQVIHAFKPELVISDIRMPGMSGFELLDKIQEVGIDPYVVMVTAYDDTQGVIDAMQKGAYDYLVKPLDLDQLDDIVDRCFHDRRSAGNQPAQPADAPVEIAVGHSLVGRDPKMLEVYKLIGMVARSGATVVIQGETGTGKELVARTIHSNSAHPGEPFIAVNCAALPDTLLESELFGHVKGAFTGAVSDRKGRFELAGKGTIFLDEIGDTTPALQAKLLRVLQEGTFFRLGGEEPLTTEARVIAASNRSLQALVKDGDFREDLFFRLRVIEITIPPLRERKGDIPLLAKHLLKASAQRLGKDVNTIPDDVMAELLAYPWPGNVRELENSITRAVVMAKGAALTMDCIELGVKEDLEEVPLGADDGTLDAVEAAHIQRVLTSAGGNKSAAARILGISRPRLDRMIEKHGLVV